MTVIELFECCGLLPNGPTAWCEPVLCDLAGVYTVTLNPNPAWNAGIPAPPELCPALRVRWLPEQPILYIGKAGGLGLKSTLRKRIRQFYRHRHGDRSPHRGGHDLKLLLPRLPVWLFWAPTEDRLAVERKILAAFRADAGHRPFASRQG